MIGLRRLAPWIAVGIVASLLGACSGTRSGAGSDEEVRRRLLRYQEVHLHQRQFFVGLARGGDLERATAAASEEITRQLTWLPSGSQDLLRGMYRVDKTAQDGEGQIHVLAVLEREAAAAHLRQLARAAETPATNRLASCAEQLHAGEVEGARSCLEQARAGLSRARQLVAASRAALGDLARPSALPGEIEADRLEAVIAASQTRRRSALVRVLQQVDGTSGDDLDGEFATLCTGLGLRRVGGEVPASAVRRALAGGAEILLGLARGAGAGYVVVGEIRSRFTAEEDGQYFALAEGSLQVYETVGGRVVAEASCRDVKGGHISRRQAGERAAREATARLKEQLRTKLSTMVSR